MTYEDEMRAALAGFVVEGRELVEELESGLLALEGGDESGEIIGALFRAAHTLKGSSGLFGLTPIVRFTHVVESVLERLRAGQITVTSELVGALLPCSDHLAGLMDDVANGLREETPEQAARGAELLDRLQPFLDDAAPASDDHAVGDDHALGADLAVPVDGRRTLHLSLRFGPDCLRNGMDPLSFIRYLSSLGDILRLTTLAGLLPEAGAMDPETSYLDFEVTLQSAAPMAEIEGVFDFVRDESAIHVLEHGADAAAYADLIASSGPLADRIREVLIITGAVDAAALASRLSGDGDPAAGAPAGAAGAGDAAPSSPGATPSAVVPAAARTGDALVPRPRGEASPATGAGGPTEAKAREARSIRIDAQRLDRLIDVVGELVIAGAGASLQASLNRDEAMAEALGELMRLVEEVRDSALQLRMVPIGSTFSRFQRVVRDVGESLGKDVALVISGGDTEVDKALVEQIGDPLMHLVRNSMDHGIEAPDVRVARGKAARGTLRLNAYHDSGSIVIEVTDDGGGIDPEKVLARGIERGLVEPGASLSEQDVFQLIFEPGFSTAETVSDLSGRGVGMDVVKRNVMALRGTVDVDSRPGEGCTMRIRLPLTLAIIDGFLVGVGGATFVVPLDRVIECVELPASAATRDCMDLRGEVLPFIRLRSLFGLHGERSRRENVVVVEYAGTKIGLVVDALMGEFQTVIKPLGNLFGHVQGIGGATILGNGDVALIIDVPMLVRHYGDRYRANHLVATA
jgi:two-component system chemotaxis sensor kinase CheA